MHFAAKYRFTRLGHIFTLGQGVDCMDMDAAVAVPSFAIAAIISAKFSRYPGLAMSEALVS